MKQNTKPFDKDFKTSKTFTVVITEDYEPEYGSGNICAALIIPEDYFEISETIEELTLYEVEGKHSEVNIDVYTYEGLSFDEALDLYKENFNSRFDEDLADQYFRGLKVSTTEYDKVSLWAALHKFQKEAKKIPTKEIRLLEEAVNRLKNENLSDDTQHNKDVKTILNYLTENLNKN